MGCGGHDAASPRARYRSTRRRCEDATRANWAPACLREVLSSHAPPLLGWSRHQHQDHGFGPPRTERTLLRGTQQFASRSRRASFLCGNAIMDTLGSERRAFRMRSGCDTTTPCAPAIKGPLHGHMAVRQPLRAMRARRPPATYPLGHGATCTGGFEEASRAATASPWQNVTENTQASPATPQQEHQASMV